MNEIIQAQLTELARTKSVDVFGTFIREPAARRYFSAALGWNAEKYAAALTEFDRRRAEFLPESIDALTPRTSGPLRAMLELISVQLRKKPLAAIRRAVVGYGNAEDAEVEIPEAWRLQLPIPPAREKLIKSSPTSLAAYVRCPFTFYLRRIFGDCRPLAHPSELESWEYGNIAHEALERWGTSSARDSADADTIAAALSGAVDELFAERFGRALPTAPAAQAEEMKARFTDFAAAQARRRAQGWRIEYVEHKMETVIGHTVLKGRCDRIDRNENTGEWRIIDYKTGHHGDDDRLQPALYRYMFGEPNTGFGFCVIGGDGDVRFVDSDVEAEAQEQIEIPQTVEAIIDKIERGIFWPPTERGRWRIDYADWLGNYPENSVSGEWIADQMQRTGK